VFGDEETLRCSGNEGEPERLRQEDERLG
jgi:hypothetical protein